jgi:arsenate reductase
MRRVGFKIKGAIEDNPRYEVTLAEDVLAMIVYSKMFDAPVNPKQGFAAIMTCSEADEACPFIPGASWRLSLPYEDPKVADDTPEEEARYDERVRQIGREILYIFRHVKNSE